MATPGYARQFVSPPAFNPSPFGLFSVADMRPTSDADPHWQNGVQWQDFCNTDGDTTYQTCTTSTPYASGTPSAKVDNGGLQWFGATPYTVFTEVDCSPVDFYERATTIAADALARVESFQVERALWTGKVDDVSSIAFPHLGSQNSFSDGIVTLQLETTVVTGVAMDIVNGLGLLEQTLASCYKGVGVIHVPPELAPSMAYYNLLVKDGTRYKTHNGNLVAIGSGYTGVSSVGTGSDSVTVSVMYATGPVFVYRGKPQLRANTDNANFDRSTNTIKAIAERTYVVGYGCCLLGLPIETTIADVSYTIVYEKKVN